MQTVFFFFWGKRLRFGEFPSLRECHANSRWRLKFALLSQSGISAELYLVTCSDEATNATCAHAWFPIDRAPHQLELESKVSLPLWQSMTSVTGRLLHSLLSWPIVAWVIVLTPSVTGVFWTSARLVPAYVRTCDESSHDMTCHMFAIL